MFFSLIVFIMLYHPAQWRSVCQLNMSAKAIRSSSILLKEDFSFFRQWRGLLSHFLCPYPFSLRPRGQTLRHWRANQPPPTLMSHPKTSLPSLRLTVSFIFGPCKHVLTVFPLEIHLLSIVYSPPVGLTFEWVVRSCSSLFCTLGVVVFCRQYGNELSNCKLFFNTLSRPSHSTCSQSGLLLCCFFGSWHPWSCITASFWISSLPTYSYLTVKWWIQTASLSRVS